MVFYTVFWDDILEINNTSKALQDPKLDVNTATPELKWLTNFTCTKRDSFKEYELKPSVLSNCQEYEFEIQCKQKITCIWHHLTVSKHSMLN